MTRQQLRPLPGLASSVSDLGRRLRAIEQNRFGITGFSASSASFTTTSASWQYPGWQLSVTLGYTGGCIAQMSVGTTLNTNTLMIYGLSVDGATPVVLGSAPNFAGDGTPFSGGLGFAGAPGTIHTVAIAVQSDGTNPSTFVTPFIAVWPL
jgi:hypothetical protein